MVESSTRKTGCAKLHEPRHYGLGDIPRRGACRDKGASCREKGHRVSRKPSGHIQKWGIQSGKIQTKQPQVTEGQLHKS